MLLLSPRLFFQLYGFHLHLLSFPTRRSSDLARYKQWPKSDQCDFNRCNRHIGKPEIIERDRKSTRLNSSHVAISYAVLCLKKKTAQYEILIDKVGFNEKIVIDKLNATSTDLA